MSDGALVVAYHGCDITVRDGLVKGDIRELTPSKNKYDWLGPGVYFFENDPERAQQFALAAHDHPTKLYTKRPIATPSVAAFKSLESSQRKTGQKMPENEAADDEDTTVLLRRLDCAVFTLLHELRAEQGFPTIQAVRAAFYQCKPLAKSTSEFREQTHMQMRCATTPVSPVGSCRPARSFWRPPPWKRPRRD